MILRQFLRKRAKIWHGIKRTFFHRDGRPYEARTWWDDEFFTKGLSDRQTLSPDKSAVSAAYHYASVELLILRHLRNHRIDLGGFQCCDLGSGSGHWIQFYLSLGVARCHGIDISEKSVAFLREQYAAEERVRIHHGRLLDALPAAAASVQTPPTPSPSPKGGEGRETSQLSPAPLRGENGKSNALSISAPTAAPFDLINAIGVMFHLVDDAEWEQTVLEIGRHTRPGGLLVAGGHFGWLDGVNVQFDEQQRVNKRLRSARRWRQALQDAGFADVTVHRNRAYLFIRDSLPENNVLVARKR